MLPQRVGGAQTEAASVGGPGGGHLDGRGAGGGRQGDQVKDVGDGGHQAVHRGHQTDQ